VTATERDRELLRYVQECIARIEQYTRDGRRVFLSEPVLQDAVLRRLETLADAASSLSDVLKARHPNIPWREIRGFRNVAAHGYLGVDLSRVWRTIEASLPPLRVLVDEELN
jgi:uncharacterized protein with HEPN domain